MPTSVSSLPNETHCDACLRACVYTFIREFHYHQTHQTASTALQVAMSQANIQAATLALDQVFSSVPPITVGFQLDACPLPHAPRITALCIATKVTARRINSIIHRLGAEVREVTIGNGPVSIGLNVGQMEDSGYIEYVVAKRQWRVTVSPSDIPLRLVEVTELTQGCQQLLTVAGCVFKTSDATPQQHYRPIEVPPRGMKRMMQSLGFCSADRGDLYRVFTSRIGRSIQAVMSIVPLVDQHGENQEDWTCVESSSLRTVVEVLERGSTTQLIQILREQSRNSVITIRGREAIRKKFSGCSSIVLM